MALVGSISLGINRKAPLTKHQKDDRAVVLFHYRDDYGRRRRHARWILRIGPWPVELGYGVKVADGGINRVFGYKVFGRRAWEVAGVGREGFHLVVDLRPPTRPCGCITGWTELEVSDNVVSKDAPWLSRDSR